MKLEIHNAGDPSVGIQPYRLTIDLGEIDGLDDAEYRWGIRFAANALGEAITGEECGCFFEDECQDCHNGQLSLVEGKYKVCDNLNCISNSEED